VAALEDRIRCFVRSLLQEFGPGTDLHRDFSSRVPTFVLAELLGVPEDDRAMFDPWVSALTVLQDEGQSVLSSAPTAVAGAQVVAEMFEYFSAMIGQRRTQPQDDLAGALVAAELEGERLSDWDILGFCFVMVAGGNDTTGALISHGVGLLDDFPDERRLLLEDPSLIPAAVTEFLRMESSVQGLARTTTRDVVVGGVEIPEGEKVLMLYGSANRDTTEFGADADRLDVRRDAQRHLGFSSGPHFCIGSHLAKLQARVAFEELLATYPEIGVDRAAGVRHRSAFTRGWQSLPATGVNASG
jgi:cytochrome P450